MNKPEVVNKLLVDGDIIAFRDCGPYDISINHEGTEERLYLSFDLNMDYLKDYLN